MSNDAAILTGLPAGNTLGSRLLTRHNNFDFIRLAAAFLVIVSHSWPIRDGNTDNEPYHRLGGYCIFGEVAVGIFFIVSGMLVARSFLSDPEPIPYLRKRSLRIFPGLIVCVLFCIFVVGPIFTTLGFRDYLFNHETFRFARNAVLYPNHYHLPGVFEQFDTTDRRYVVNGSLWSLPFEFLMYLVVLALGVTRLLNRKSVVAALTVLLAAQWIWASRLFAGESDLADRLWKYRVWIEITPMLGLLFFSGTLMLLFRDRVPVSGKLFLVCLAVVVTTWHTTHDWLAGHIPLVAGWNWQPWHGYLALCLCLPYMVMYLAFVRVPVLQSVTKWGDFSYGVYLYAYPVQQALMRTWGDRLPFPAFMGLACGGTLVLAVLSWHLVEKPFLKLKRRSTRVEPGVVEKGTGRAYASVVA